MTQEIGLLPHGGLEEEPGVALVFLAFCPETGLPRRFGIDLFCNSVNSRELRAVQNNSCF